MADYSYKESDNWVWSRATSYDVPEMVELSYTFYKDEFENIIFNANMTKMQYHLHKAILDQTYNLNTLSIAIARDKTTNRLIAWNWLERGKYMIYSDDEVAVAEFIHIALDLPKKDKIALVVQTLEQWQLWCEYNRVPVLCSTSIRPSQSGFMRLHEKMGFSVRGSFAYKKIF